MDWRKPEAWPQPVQRASWLLAVVIGFVPVSPWWVRAWQDWQAAETALTQFEALLEETQTLRRETVQMQATPAPEALTFIGASEISHLAQLNGLKPTTVVMDRAIPSAATEAVHVQQWPIHLHATGSWASWLGWLAQWPTAMPGVTMASLDLRADAQGGVTVQVGLLSPRVLTPATPVVSRDKLSQATPTNRDPFDIKAWHQALALQAQQHPSYALHAAPELRRMRQMLETFPRNQLRYVGHLSSGAELQALIQVPAADGKTNGASPPVHRVRAGDRLGQDFGQVLLVEKHQLQLRELTANPQGEWQMRQVVMPLEVSP
jgi:type IV pilus assembly protein PilP